MVKGAAMVRRSIKQERVEGSEIIRRSFYIPAWNELRKESFDLGQALGLERLTDSAEVQINGSAIGPVRQQ